MQQCPWVSTDLGRPRLRLRRDQATTSRCVWIAHTPCAVRHCGQSRGLSGWRCRTRLACCLCLWLRSATQHSHTRHCCHTSHSRTSAYPNRTRLFKSCSCISRGEDYNDRAAQHSRSSPLLRLSRISPHTHTKYQKIAHDRIVGTAKRHTFVKKIAHDRIVFSRKRKRNCEKSCA
jgi:hypothetical protein